MTARHRTLLLDAPSLSRDVLSRLAPGDASAIREGRLFADRRRVKSETEQLGSGVTVDWYGARAPAASSRDPEEPRVLEEREGIVALYKPAAWSSEPDRTGQRFCLTSFLNESLRVRRAHIATRLDVGVSGLVLAATDPPSQKRLTTLSQSGSLHRTYVAIALGLAEGDGIWRGSVEATGAARKSASARSPGAPPRDAITRFEYLAHQVLPGVSTTREREDSLSVSLLCFRPETGRKHQLRIHASRSGHPLLGDPRYGGPSQLVLSNGRIIELPRIFLQAVRTCVPIGPGRIWTVDCPIDSEVGGLWSLLGGHHADFAF